MTAFEELGVLTELANAVNEMDWTQVLLMTKANFVFRLPTDIQSDGIPAILGGGDVLMVIFFQARSIDPCACMSFMSFSLFSLMSYVILLFSYVILFSLMSFKAKILGSRNRQWKDGRILLAGAPNRLRNDA